LGHSEFATRDVLRSFVHNRAGLASLVKAVHLAEAPAQAAAQVFLSHSHRDKELAEWARDFFAMFGKTVYVDWWDDSMPSVPDAATALRLREKIGQKQSKFVLLATENSLDSNWVAWELGYADGTKPASHLASFPVAADPGQKSGHLPISCVSGESPGAVAGKR
jgi:hypothetical protein